MSTEWGDAELAKPLADRHMVMQWYDATCRLQAKNIQGAEHDGVFRIEPSGAMRAFLILAYDLYVLKSHQLLEDRLLHRLRHSGQYQGARHELFAAATCLRAGFDIKYEDESDGSRKHTEFTAINRRGGVSLCVEAKSKHRSGVLGMEGDRVSDENVRTRLGGLINDALKKPHEHPLAIFVDLNLPPTSPAYGTRDWFKFVDPILRGIDRKVQEDPWDIVVFSNQPDHYAIDDKPASAGYAVGMFGKNSRVGTQPPAELAALIGAANKFGAIPNRFEEM